MEHTPASVFVASRNHVSMAAFLQNLDTQLQRTLNMDDFDTAQEIRKRRKEIDEVVAEQLVSREVMLNERNHTYLRRHAISRSSLSQELSSLACANGPLWWHVPC